MKKTALLMQSAANGGVQRVMINLARGMLDQDIEVDFLIADASGEMKEQIPDKCQIYDFGKRRYRGDLKVFLSLSQIAKYIKHNPDTVIYAAPGLSCTVAAFLKIIYPYTRTVLINDNKCSLLKGSGLYHHAVYCVNKIVYRFADEVAAAHTSAMQDIAENYHIKADRLHVIYHPLIDMNTVNAAPPEAVHPYVHARKKGFKLLLAVGRLVPEKAFDNLIDAVSIVRKKQKVKLLILGEGVQREYLQKRINEKNLQDDVCLFGYTDRVFSFMKSADLYVLSSRQEAFGNVLVEAIACGLPCVATDCESGGPREIMGQTGAGKYGVLCERENVAALADGISTALEMKYDTGAFHTRALQFEIGYAAERYTEIVEDPKQ